MAKKTSAKKTKIHHKVGQHLDKPVNTIIGYTVILVFLVVTLVILAGYL